MKGLIQSYSVVDGLGTVLLEDGSTLDFGGSACPDRFIPEVGNQVVILEVGERRGRKRALRLEPFELKEMPKEWFWPLPEKRTDGITEFLPFDLATFAQEHPDWFVSNAGAAQSITPSKNELWSLDHLTFHHPFFQPWLSQIKRTAVPCLKLSFKPRDKSTLPAPIEGLRATPCGICGIEMSFVGLFPESLFHPMLKVPGDLALFACVQDDEDCAERPGNRSEQWMKAHWIKVERPADYLRLENASLVRPLSATPSHSLMSVDMLDMYRLIPDEWFMIFNVTIREEEDSSGSPFCYNQMIGCHDSASQIGGYPQIPQPAGMRKCPDCEQPMKLLLCLDRDSGISFGMNELALYLYFCDQTSSCAGLSHLHGFCENGY